MALAYQQIDSNKRKSWLLVGGFIVVVTLIGWVFSQALDNPSLLIGASIFSAGYAWFSYYFSDSMVESKGDLG